MLKNINMVLILGFYWLGQMVLPAQALVMTTDPLSTPSTPNTLTVTGGTGSGTYTNGALIPIAANEPAAGTTFYRWGGDTQFVANVTASNTTVTMTSNVIIGVTALYTNLPGYFTLTVNNGAGSGSYSNGVDVQIEANTPLPGQVFTQWTGATQFVANVTASNTTVTMPSNAISLTAVYTNDPSWRRLIVDNGTGNGWYPPGTLVNIEANTQSGFAFSRWTGAIQYIDNVEASSAVVTIQEWAITLTPKYVSDTNAPGISLRSPSKGQRIVESNNVFEVFGTAGDNHVVADVRVKLNNGTYQSAFTTNRWKNWSYITNLATGTNTILVYSVDTASNVSAVVTSICTYAEKSSLTIITNGAGVVSLSPPGPIAIGTSYKMVAKPKSGSVFVNWTGDMPSTNREIMFTMDAEKTVTAHFTDVQNPTLRITAPSSSQKILATNGSFIVSGSAADNTTLSQVQVMVNGSLWVDAETTNGWKNWSMPAMLIAGTNLITARCVDTTSNTSIPVTVKCVYIETGTLILQTNGMGTITRSPAGLPELGKNYKLTAAPKSGYMFSHWSGDAAGTNNVINFSMTSNKTMTAHFIDNQKPLVKITYPAVSAKVLTNGAVILRGTASDNGSLGDVRYQLYTGEWTNAVSTNGWKNWSANYNPLPGLNTTKVYSVDVQGNCSLTSTVVFTYLPGAVMTVQTNRAVMGTISPSYNGKVLQIGSTNLMTATAQPGYVFTNWTYGLGGAVATNSRTIQFVMQSNLVLTANFRGLTPPAVASALEVMPPAVIQVDGLVDDWTGIPRASFNYHSVTQEVASTISGKNIALLLTGCPFDVSDTVLVYFKLRLTYGDGDDRHTLDLWTSGSQLYAMVDGQVVTGLKAVLLNGVLEVKLPVEETPSQVMIEEVSCGMDSGDGTLRELFWFKSP